ncbi:hypothetical protein ACFT5B_01200 [Luteimicrobium sp. NPDC057192]|uniref:hypothetical protein n=1 Tax=Luteimicrobium sp. NPDC057192 TaxID=3346042 RepID=UPI00363724CB
MTANLSDLRAEMLPRLAVGVDRGLSADGRVWKFEDPLNGIEIELESTPSDPDLWVVTTWPVGMTFEIASWDPWVRTWLLSAGREPLHVTVLRVGRWVVTWDLAAPIRRPARWHRVLARLPGVRVDDLTVREIAARGLTMT